MVAPLDYSSMMPNPFESVLQGMQTGMNWQNNQAQQQAAQQAQQLKQQQQQQALAQQQALSAAMQGLTGKISEGNATAADFAQFRLLAPKDQSEAAGQVLESMSSEEQKNTLLFGSQVLSAAATNPQIAIDILTDRAAALRGSGKDREASASETWAKLIGINPVGAQAVIGSMIAGMPGGDKVLDAWSKSQGEGRAAALHPSVLSEAQSKAQSAAVAAKFAESNAALDLQKKGWDITKLQEDIKINKENSRIAALNAGISREGNMLKRQEMGLKLQEMKDKRDEAVRGKVSEIETARGDMDNFINTVDRFLSASVGKDGKPTATIRAAAGPLDQMLPTIQPDVADLEALAETIGSQAFMAQIPKMKGTGALSEGEGKKLQASLQNFSLKQSPERLIDNMKEAQRLILKGRSNLAKKYGVPDAVPDTPAAAPSAGEIDALLKKYGG